MLFTTFSHAVPRCMGAAIVCLAWMSSAVLDLAVSCFLARLVERKCYSHNRKTHSDHCSRQLFIQSHGSGNLWIGPKQRGGGGKKDSCLPAAPNMAVLLLLGKTDWLGLNFSSFFSSHTLLFTQQNISNDHTLILDIIRRRCVSL